MTAEHLSNMKAAIPQPPPDLEPGPGRAPAPSPEPRPDPPPTDPTPPPLPGKSLRLPSRIRVADAETARHSGLPLPDARCRAARARHFPDDLAREPLTGDARDVRLGHHATAAAGVVHDGNRRIWCCSIVWQHSSR